MGPHYPRAVFYLGRTYRDLSEPNLAVDYYQKYLDIENNPFIDERWQAAYDAADCLVNLGEFVQAQKYLDLAFTIDSRRAETHNLQGRIFELKGEIKAAQTEYKNAILPIPNNVVLFLNPLEYSIYPKDKVALLSYQQREYHQAAEMGKELIEESFGTIHSPRMAENMFWYSKKKNPKIFMMLGTTPEPIYGGVMEDRGVHGLETTYLELSEELEKIGCDIYLFCNTKKEHVYKGVYYIPWNRREHYQNICPDVMITSREFDGIQYECPKILWMQDIFYSGTSSILSSIQKIICSSQWHKNYLFSKLGPQIKNAIEVIPLGIRRDWFPKGIVKIKNTAMYTSSPDRGLDALITMWPQITERVPDIELSIVYGWDSGDKWAMPEEQKQEYIKGKNTLIEKALAFSNIKLTGRITKKELYTELSKTEMVLYPSHFYETFCLSAIEAQYANATLITSDIGALQDVVNPDFNIMIPGSSYSPIYQEKYVDAVEKVSKWGSRLASTHHICNWSEIADKWIEMIWKLT
jgi:glycosyltransferase involved in cell wall biosynthesis